MSEVVFTGVGVTSSIGSNTSEFSDALYEMSSSFRVMHRPGRQTPNAVSAFIGAEIDDQMLSSSIDASLIRNTTLSCRILMHTLQQAWLDASLAEVDPKRIGLIIGGNNFNQREQVSQQMRFIDKIHFLRPSYGMNFMDTDAVGIATEMLGIQGPSFTLGGASASGQLAVIQAVQMVQSGQVDACIAIGAMMDVSFWELHAFHSLGAMGSVRFANAPHLACRPFDRERDGFIFGENCAAVVVEALGTRQKQRPYARYLGHSHQMDANRLPNPSLAGEIAVIQSALSNSRVSAAQIDYVNPHGSGSNIGDTTELNALSETGLRGSRINTTKSITGHGLTSAGAVEIAATLIQMKQGWLHGSKLLDNVEDRDFNWVFHSLKNQRVETALCLSYGFGGTNSAICFAKY